MQKPAKNRRAEQQFTEAQRKKMLWLYNSGYGISAVMERFGLSEIAAESYIHQEQAAIRAKDRAGVDWAAKFAQFLT